MYTYIYIYIYNYIIYIYHSRELGQSMGLARKRTHELQTSRKIQEECKTATNTSNCCIQQRNSLKMMQESITTKYNKLLSFRHEEVIIQNLEGVLQSVHQISVYSYTYFIRPQFRVHRKVEILVISAMIVITKQIQGYICVFQYVLCLVVQVILS